MTTKDRPTISAVVVARNEAALLDACLSSVRGWVDEIVVVDMYSTDNTREVAERYNARIFDHELAPFVEPVRNFALSRATGDWIIMLDPDESIPLPLAQELLHLSHRPNLDVVNIPRQTAAFGKPLYSSADRDTPQPRYFRNGAISWPPGVHELPKLSSLQHITLPWHGIDYAIYHNTWGTVEAVLSRINRYSRDDARRLQLDGKMFSLRRLLNEPRRTFIKIFIEEQAYLDGMPGLLTSLYQALYRLTIQARLWELDGRSSTGDASIALWGHRFMRLHLVYKASRSLLRWRLK